MRTRLRSEDGQAALLLAPMLVAVVMLAVAIVDVTAYLAAASEAQSLADAAALAAVTARDHPATRSDPSGRAHRVAVMGGGRLERCDCGGRGPVEVEVSVEVDAAVITRFAGRRVYAVASAELIPVDPPGR